VVLTHARGRLEELEAALRRRGDEVVRAPLIETVPCADGATRAAARRLLTLPWLLFPSRSAVEAWSALGLPLPGAPHGPELGAVGGATAAALAAAGARATLIGEPATAEGLVRAFLARRDAAGPVGLPRGDRARKTLQERLEAAGVEAVPVTLYRTETRPWRGGAEADAVVVASPSAAEGLPEDVAGRAALVALGPTTGAALHARGFSPWIAARPDAQAVLDRLDAARRAAEPNAGRTP
jgi:uroporphyrinogen-III synthase